MKLAEKHEISKAIVNSLNRICLYEDAIKRIGLNDRLFYEGTIQIRLVGVRNTIWEELTKDECVSF